MIYGIILLAALTRLVPHMPNVGLVTAVAIFAGAYMSTRKALGVTFLVRLFSDIAIGFFAWKLMVAVYIAHLAGVGIGRWVGRSTSVVSKWLKVGASGFISAGVFFLLTNFALLYAEYPHTWAGVVEAYTNGLPFLRGTLIGDVSATVVLFLAYAFVQVGWPALRSRLQVKSALNV